MEAPVLTSNDTSDKDNAAPRSGGMSMDAVPEAAPSGSADMQAQLNETIAHAESLELQLKHSEESASCIEEAYQHNARLLKREQLSIFRPIYRRFYRGVGRLLRRIFPGYMVERWKRILPEPEGVPARLRPLPPGSSRHSKRQEAFSAPLITALPDVFVFSIIGWDFRFQRPQHIAQRLAKAGNRVFYIEMEMSGAETLITKRGNNLYVVRLASKQSGVIPPYSGKPTMKQTRRWVKEFYAFCDDVRSTSYSRAIIQHPYWWQLARHLSSEYYLLFDCMDDISGFSNTDPHLLDLEEDMLRNADQVIVSSQHLYNKHRHHQEPILIHNAADIEHFISGSSNIETPKFSTRSRHQETNNVIRVGYVGAIAEWFDVGLIRSVARDNPDFEFHFCGDVTTPEAVELEDLGNVIFYGEVPYESVPGFIDEMDVMSIPFMLLPLIQACDPVKFYEYSAMGKPTVSTPLPELERAGDLVFIASTPVDFADRIRDAHARSGDQSLQESLHDFARENNWNQRVEQLQHALDARPLVSVIILSFGDPDLTGNTLYSLFERGATYPRMEVIVVDNGSSPEDLNQVRNHAGQYQNIRVIHNDENVGFAAGNNIGIRAATGEYVLLLNNDTAVAPGAIAAMARHLSRNSTIGVVGPLTNNIGNEARVPAEYHDMHEMRQIARQVTTGYRGMVTCINVTAYFAAMFRRSDLTGAFGLLPEEYGLGMFEDDDHCNVIRQCGYECVLAEDAFIHHHLSGSFSKLASKDRKDLFDANRVIYEKKWGPWKPHQYRDERPISSLGEQLQ